MNYLIFACIGLGIIVLISFFMTLDKIQRSVNNMEIDLDYTRRNTNDIEHDITYINHHLHEIKLTLTEKKEIGE